MPDSLDKNSPVYDMVYSGARGSFSQITQMVGMKGLIQSATGETIEFPILSSMKEGLTPIEYFITTHGSRKGLTDTALNTAKAGYLTRKLFVVAQDNMISEKDCGTKEHIIIKRGSASGIEVALSKNIRGRVLAETIENSKGGVLFKKGHLLTKEDAVLIQESDVSTVAVRSPLSCKAIVGICAKCYGADLGKGGLVGLGEAVGTIAGQAIGEPGTQLTMRTFHAGGTASLGGDITQGLPRVEELFEKRSPKNPAVIAVSDGLVTEIKVSGKDKVIVVTPDIAGKPKGKKSSDKEYPVAFNRVVLVKVGDIIKKGDRMTDGSVDIDELFKYGGAEATEDYIITEVSKPYELQGEAVARKHIEIIVRQMFSRSIVTDGGGTPLSKGEIVTEGELRRFNEKALERGLPKAVGERTVMGISEASLSRRSFLSAASFQHTTRVLINAAIKGSNDKLIGLMENVIIGRLIPAGSGFSGGAKEELVKLKTAGRKELYNEGI